MKELVTSLCKWPLEWMLPTLLYTLSFLFSRKARIGELVSKRLYPLDSTHLWVGLMCWRQPLLPLPCPFGLFLLRLREVIFHFPFSCSEPDFCSLSQHFRWIIWTLHPQLSRERLWHSTFVLRFKPCLSAQFTQQSYILIAIEKLPRPQVKPTLWALWGFSGYFLLTLEHPIWYFPSRPLSNEALSWNMVTWFPNCCFFFFPWLIFFPF